MPSATGGRLKSVAACERRSPSGLRKGASIWSRGEEDGHDIIKCGLPPVGAARDGPPAKARVLDEKLHVRALRGDPQPFVDALSPYECFQDAPFTDPRAHPVIARHFPDAKFVLTTRSPDVWAASALRWTQLRSRAYAPYADHFWAAMGSGDELPRDEAAGLAW